MKWIHMIVVLALASFPVSLVAAQRTPQTVSITFTVNSVADSVDVNPGDGVCMDASGQCSLRAAIMEANAHFAPDTIVFDPITDGQPILLQLHGAGEDAAATGDLDITDDLTITGNGSGKTIVDGDAADRVFDVHPAASTMTVEIDDLTVQNGSVSDFGGGIQVQNSTLILNRDLIQHNTATGVGGLTEGGGIYGLNANVTLDQTTVDSNTVNGSFTGNGGGIAIGFSSGNTSTLNVLDGSVISNNIAFGDQNDADGGGIAIDTGNVLMMDSSAVRFNTATDTTANESAYGGGVYVANSSYSIVKSEISGNVAQGDAIVFGGGFDAEHTVANSSIVNTTIANNTISASATSGTIYGAGASIDSTPTGLTETLANVTISGNSVGATSGGGGGGLDVYNNSGTVLIKNSLVAGNQDSTAAAPDCVGSLGGTITSGGYNLIGDSTGCPFGNATGDQIGTGTAPIDPMLGSLTDNGGKSWTMALLAGSPAVDTGNPGGCTDASGTTLTVDQRNFPRPTDGNASGTPVCDVGAYERAADTPPVALPGGLSVTENSSGNGVLAATDADGDPLTFSIASQPSHGSVTLTDPVTGAYTYTPAHNYTGSDSFTYTANDGFVNSTAATESITITATPSSSGGGGGGLEPVVLIGLLLILLARWSKYCHRSTTSGEEGVEW